MRIAVLAVFALLLGAPVAQAQTTKAVIERYNLLGTFSVNCAKPAAKDNAYIVRRPIDDDRVQVDVMVGPTERLHANVVDKATGLGPNELMVSVTSEAAPRAEILLRLEPGRTRTVESTNEDGKKTSANGIRADGQFSNPWFYRCDGPSTAAVFEKRNLIGTFAVDCRKPVARNNYYTVFRKIDNWRVQGDLMTGAKEVANTRIYERAVELSADQVGASSIAEPVDYIFRTEGNRFRIWFGARAYGAGKFSDDPFIADGRGTSGGREELPWMTKCK